VDTSNSRAVGGGAGSAPTAAGRRRRYDCRVGRKVQYRAIADAIGAQIDAGELPPGTRLPTETALAAQFGVHRLTARQAMTELRRTGRVETRQGSGSVVRAAPRTYDATIDPLTMRHNRKGIDDLGATEEVVDRAMVVDDAAAEHLHVPDGRVARIETVTRSASEPVVRSWYHLLPELLDIAPADGDVLAALAMRRPGFRYSWHVVSADLGQPDDEAMLGLSAETAAVLVREGLVADGDTPICHILRRCRGDRIAFLSRYHPVLPGSDA
jgi:GntR family transcriptional regulator